ncbi:MAG: nucleotidyltransferase domain-containing protein [Bacillota bacterium]|nr:nucleotidyltransferase domain-containing protein [Bacillota bacterium]
MNERQTINDRLVEWIRETVACEYRDDIDLVIIYGSYLDGTANPQSDVDCYFVPRTPRGHDFSRTFILAGVGYDIYPRSWENLEAIARLQGIMQPLVGDARVLYARDDAAAERFRSLRQTLNDSLADTDLVQQAARNMWQEAARVAAGLGPGMPAAEIWRRVGLVIMILAEAVAVSHQGYFHSGLKRQYEDLGRIPGLPPAIPDGYRAVVEAAGPEAAAQTAARLLEEVRIHLGLSCTVQEAAESKGSNVGDVNAAALAGLYEEISSTFIKVRRSCAARNHILAFLSAVCLQDVLDEATALGAPAYGLLEGFHYEALDRLADRAEQIEADLRRFIVTHGGTIKEYDSWADFETEQGSV